MTNNNNVMMFVVSALLLVVTMAVDRTKFRTCDKTSFCRRHRGQHSGRLYKYSLDYNSIKLHMPPSRFSSKEEEEEQGQDSSEGKENKEEDVEDNSMWSSMKKRILGSVSTADGGNNKNALDPYVRGPSTPTLTGIINNVAKETSTGSVEDEKLQLSLYALSDGMVRMRITEMYGTKGKAYEKARVTYDELVLKDYDKLHLANNVELISLLSDDNNNNNINKEQHKELFKKLGVDNKDSNHVVLKYGDDKDDDDSNDMLLLIRLNPFSIYLYYENNIDVGPIVTYGDKEYMHYEIRRYKDDGGNVNNKQDEEELEEDEEDSNDKKDEEKKEEKEIVGYWEDGLAIYADGTREERKEESEEDIKKHEEHHRHLLEEEVDSYEIDKSDMWEEDFSSHKDTKPYGPTSVGYDVNFPKSTHIYGLPEHASSTQLKTTYGEQSYYTEPYRLYNLDVFEYELDETMALYGHVPLIISHSSTTSSVGVFAFNPTETFVDIDDDVSNSNEEEMTTHWISESGIIDIFFIPGPTIQRIYNSYGTLTGYMPLPPMFSLGYHQCRWNYKDEKDVYHVHGKFEELDYPYDVLWLDIEHTDGKRYFTWDYNLFPNPTKMFNDLWDQGRRMVTIIDPHIKRDDNYYVHKKATADGCYIKDKDGKKDFDGWCWPGSSSYLDFTNERVRGWWASQFAYKNYAGSTPSLFTWNDMNEPSVFNGPEVSMSKDLRNLAGDEHREWHNLYGMLFHRSTSEGLIKRNQPDENIRPFVLSRAFFAGSQLYGAIWTGDNAANWDHLAISSPMLLSLNIAALSFVGADVGGFFGNTDEELMVRWMQAGAYQPFFRGHAHHDANRREPWMFGDDAMVKMRSAAMARYALLPYWYTIFREAGVTGMPVMRMMWMHYPQTKDLYSVDDQYLIGSDLLVKPVTSAGVTQSTIQFPTNDIWYDVDTMKQISTKGPANGISTVTLKSDIDKIPVYQRGGSIIPRKLRLRRSSALMKTDPYTLYVALDKESSASGTLYMDDEETFNHDRKGDYAVATFTANLKDGIFTNTVAYGTGYEALGKVDEVVADRMIERIIIMGMNKSPKSITIVSGGATADSTTTNIEYQFNKSSSILVMRKPDVSAFKDWEIRISQ